jgi:hypothetical protein
VAAIFDNASPGSCDYGLFEQLLTGKGEEKK